MTTSSEWLSVESIDLEAQGVAHNADGKVVFIEGALPGEQVQVQVGRKKNAWEQGTMIAMRRESTLRVRPGCPHFGLHPGACGGCKMQHVDASAQVAVKQRVLEDNLLHLARIKPELMLRPIEGPTWGYRYRARLSVRHVAKKGTVLVGFHERKSRYLADMRVCPVLPAKMSRMLLPLRALIGAMDQRDTLPQIELAIGELAMGELATGALATGESARGESGAGDKIDRTVIALVLRHLAPVSPADAHRLRAFAAQHGVQWWLQPKGPDTVHLLDDGGPELTYGLPEFGITMPFKPTDFTQVNHAINTVLVGRALRLLAPLATERVIDWFCGLGNFTLPIATRAGAVLGIEGSPTLVQRARDNAQRNGLAGRATFAARNLFELSADDLVALGAADKWLVDPPREGAFALAKALVDLNAAPRDGWLPPQRIVYVSCNPSTLARDAGLLVHQAGYRCVAAGAVNMFPHTAHVESMAVFERG